MSDPVVTERVSPDRLFGLMAEFDTPQALLEAAEKTYEAGYRQIDGYSPMPIEELADALGLKDNRLPWLVLFGGIFGAVGGFGLQYWISVIEFPLNVGGRPYNSWPSFIVITFEMSILFAALAAVLGMLALNGLPQPYHPVFNVERFKMASEDRFFLLIAHHDPKFDPEETRAFLESFDPAEVADVEK